MILYTRLVPKPFAGITLWPLILIRPEYRGDETLLAHEMVHYREQAWLAPLWWLWYACNKEFRVDAEVRAYKVSVANGMPLTWAAEWLCRYDDKLTQEIATRLLLES